MNGQVVAVAVLMALLVPGLTWSLLWSTSRERVGKYTARHRATPQTAFLRAVGEATASFQKMGPAFQQMGAAANKTAEAMKRLGEQIKQGKDYRDGNDM